MITAVAFQEGERFSDERLKDLFDFTSFGRTVWYDTFWTFQRSKHHYLRPGDEIDLVASQESGFSRKDLTARKQKQY